MNRVFINPTYKSPDQADGGIRRVVEAMVAYLPRYGWASAPDPRDADLIVNHGASLLEIPGVPMVAACHGLMWEEYGFGQWGDDVNKHVIEVMARADAITAPSRWVAHAITRGMLRRPEVVYHGVTPEDWAHDMPHLGYVLWNKARTDPVSDPRDLQDVAALLPDIPFLSTFAEPARNIQRIGAIPYDQMKTVIQRAGVYLATARETFGIGTLEALAAGVPIAGWRYGGQAEIVRDGETGYLAEWGDYQGLADAIRRCLDERDLLSRNAVRDAGERWRWEDKILHYATLFDRTLARHRAHRPKVTVVVTCHNLARYLGDCLQSLVRQTINDWECLIIDDQSTDETETVAMSRVKSDDRFRYERTPENLKLSGARNYGWRRAKGKYILFLDADDMLTPNALDLLSTALDQDRGLHIAAGHLDLINDRGEERRKPSGWPVGRFDWRGQLAHLNQIPYCSMMRREVLEESGGYRTRDWRAEDAAFWSRVTSFGFRAAKVTEDSVLIYRLRGDSKSRGEDGDGDWTAFLPWKLAETPQAGLEAIRQGRYPNAAIVPFGAQGTPQPPRRAWPVYHHQEPTVAVVIPVGPGHAQYLIDALDSVQAQTFPFWECIVVNDTGKPLDPVGSPWTRQIDGGGLGAGAARNRGLKAVRAPLVVFLDADDILSPFALQRMIEVYAETGRYVYSDWAHLEDESKWDGDIIAHEVPEYDAGLWLQGAQHAVTCLVETEHARAVGGFDEALPAWEDWDFLIKLAVRGVCGTRVPIPLLIYRLQTGERRKVGDRAEERLLQTIRDRYQDYTTGGKAMGSCCGGAPASVMQSVTALDELFGDMGMVREAFTPPPPDSGPVRMEFIGDTWGAQTWLSEDRQRQYRAGRDPSERYVDVTPEDVAWLVRTGSFRVVALPPAAVAVPDAPDGTFAVEVAPAAESVTRKRARSRG